MSFPLQNTVSEQKGEPKVLVRKFDRKRLGSGYNLRMYLIGNISDVVGVLYP